MQLSEYVHLFHEAEDVAWIDKLDRRYAWFKKSLLSIEDKFGAMFPADWELSEQITVEFCSITRYNCISIIDRFANSSDIVSLFKKKIVITLHERILPICALLISEKSYLNINENYEQYKFSYFF